MSLLGIASLALKVGPAAIRGVSAMLGSNETANKLAAAVESANKILDPNEREQVVHNALEKMSPSEQIKLGELKVAMEKELTERARIAADDKQNEHQTTQNTVQNGDNAKDWLVRATRPLMALISTCSGSYYVITNDSPDLTIAGVLFLLGTTYMGLRHREKNQGIAS
jgi:hypothetical protein